jgi:hypothetical protein
MSRKTVICHNFLIYLAVQCEGNAWFPPEINPTLAHLPNQKDEETCNGFCVHFRLQSTATIYAGFMYCLASDMKKIDCHTLISCSSQDRGSTSFMLLRA